MIKIRQIIMMVLLLAQGIFEVIKSANNLEELEERVQTLVQKAAGMLLVEALQEIDKRLGSQKDSAELKNIGMRPRTIITSFGEITYRRRMYQNTKTKEYHFLLDEAMGIGGHRRLSPRMEKLSIELGTEVPFRRAAKILEYIVPGVNAMTVWKAVQKAGKGAVEEARTIRDAVFEKGVIPPGEKKIKALYIEADGVMIRQQKARKRHEEIKLVVAYEGKEGLTRRSLVNRRTIAGMLDGEGIWEEVGAVIGHKWDLSMVEKIRIGGDGAWWVKGGINAFPGASYHLDRFHLRKRLTEALAFNRTYYEAVCNGLEELNQEGTMAALDKAIRVTQGATRKRVKELKKYLLENWEGVSSLPEEERLGAIEGQARHTIARRMKKNGARWTPVGADRMARLLAAKANGELGNYAGKSNNAQHHRWEILRQVVGDTAIEPQTRVAEKDLEAWLRASLPALSGPFADKAWIKYVLRGIASIQRTIA